MDGIFGSKTPLPVQAANFLRKSHCTSQCLQHTTLMDIRIKTIPQVTKAAVHPRMKFLSNSCQQEGNEASALAFPREIAGLSLKLMRQCLFTVELPLNKNGRKCFFFFVPSTPPTHLIYCMTKVWRRITPFLTLTSSTKPTETSSAQILKEHN